MPPRIIETIDKHISGKPELKRTGPLVVYCNACQDPINIRSASVKYPIDSHCSSQKHKRNMKRWTMERSSQPSAAEMMNYSQPFAQSMAEMLVSCNIPWSKVNHVAFRQWVDRWTAKSCPDEATLRKHHLDALYQDTIAHMRSQITHQH